MIYFGVSKVQEKGIKGTVGEQVNSKVNCLWKRKKRKKEEKERKKTEEQEQEQGRIRTNGILERVVNYGNVSPSLLIAVHHYGDLIVNRIPSQHCNCGKSGKLCYSQFMDFRYLVVAFHEKVCLYWKGVVSF